MRAIDTRHGDVLFRSDDACHARARSHDDRV